MLMFLSRDYVAVSQMVRNRATGRWITGITMLFRETFPLVLPLDSLPILHHIFTCSSGISVCVPVYWQQQPGISLQWKKYFSEQFGSQCSIVRNVEKDESMPRFRFSHVLLTCLALLLCIVGTGAFLSHHIAYA